MQVFIDIDEKYFSLNGIRYSKIYQPLKQGLNALSVVNSQDTGHKLFNSTDFSEISIDSVVQTSQADAIANLLPVIYLEEAVFNYYEGDQVINNYENAPDEEDLTESSSLIQFKDRANYKYVRSGFDYSTLASDTIYEVRESHDLGGSSIIIPASTTLRFKGGKLSNGTIIINGLIEGRNCFDTDIVVATENDNATLDSRWFGQLDTDLINDLFQSNDFENIFIKSGRYTIDATIENPKALNILSDGKIVFDASESSIDDYVVHIGETDTTLITSLALTLPKGSDTVTVSGHGLTQGDIVVLIDDSDYSFSEYRTYYKKGEYLRVQSIDGDDITFEQRTRLAYNSSSVIHKCILREFHKSHEIEVIAPTGSFSRGIYLRALKDSHVDKWNVRNASYASLTLKQCLNVSVNQHLRTVIDAPATTDYGIAISNSQKITVQGHFKGVRHAFTTGGGSDFPAIHCMDISADGIFETSGEGNVLAADVHGNILGYRISGHIIGGISPAGADGRVDATIEAGPNGYCVYFGEMKNHNHNFSNCIMNGNGEDPFENLRGTIDIGGNTKPNEFADNEGCLNFSNVTVNAPASRLPIYIQNSNSGARNVDNVTINLAGFSVLNYDNSLGYYGRVRNLYAPTDYKIINLLGANSNPTEIFSVVDQGSTIEINNP